MNEFRLHSIKNQIFDHDNPIYDFRRCSDNDFMQHNFSDSNKFQKSKQSLRTTCGTNGDFRITDVDSKTVACVQDELGDVFIYDLENCTVIEQITFEGRETLKA
ncbi:MAG: hypothetical protein H6577_27910 [Lewinellaceae bacterium]|nr:hypothetical protein [Lewinellaceae bacterium]